MAVSRNEVRISTSDIPPFVRDTRPTYKRKLAVYLILGSLACERSAYYILDYNLTNALQAAETLNWSEVSSSTAFYIFEGKLYRENS